MIYTREKNLNSKILLLLTFLFIPSILLAQEGFLKVTVDTEKYFIVVNDNFEQAHSLSYTDSIALKPGTYNFKLVSPFQNDKDFTTEIKQDSTQSYKFIFYNKIEQPRNSSFPLLYWDSNLIIFSDKDAEIYLDETKINGSSALLNLDDGSYSVSAKNNGYETSETIQVRENQFQVITLSTRPIKKRALKYSAVPGLSQFYKRQGSKALIFSTASILAATYTLNHQSKFIKADNKLRNYRRLYRGEFDPSLALEYGNQIEKYSELSEDHYRKRNIGLGVSIGVYVLNILDGFLSEPDRGYYQGWEFDPYTDYFKDEQVLGLSLKKHF